jgi:hypothetical protein
MRWLKHVDIVGALLLWSLSFMAASISESYAQQSAMLSSGQVFRLAITKSGVHKVDQGFLKTMGVDVASLNPDKIRLFGNGGRMLPQKNADNRQSELMENAVWIQGGEDGKFDAADALFFYAEGPHVVIADTLTRRLSHQINHYSDTTFYFLAIGAENGLRIKFAPGIPSGAAQSVTSTFTDYWFHEKELVNVLKSGREWWGEYITGAAPFTLKAPLPGITPGSEMYFSGSALGSAQVSTKFFWQVNGQLLGESAVRPVGAGTYDIRGQRIDVRYAVTAPPGSPDITLGVSYDRNGQSSAQGYLNYMALQVQRELAPYAEQQVYRFFPGSSDTATYQFKNTTSDFLLWDITNKARPVSLPLINGRLASLKGQAFRSFIGFNTSQAYIPDTWQILPHQSISSPPSPDLLIVTASAWKAQAQQLASFREENDGLQTLVVTQQEIYNEFSSGKPDVSAIRDFAKKLYDQESGKLKYLLLFGDASYDYRNILKGQSAFTQHNLIPVYESRESLNPVYTYSSDDFFGFMEDHEGEWIETGAGNHSLDIGVGRLPVKSVTEAQTVVDKLIRYGSQSYGKGIWRNKIAFVADDGDGNIHQKDADSLASMSSGSFFTSRIFLDAYPQTTSELGQRVPAVNEQIRKNINEGVLILNYTGHGGTSGWAEEQVLTIGDMQSVRGMENLPLLLTATCDFGRYDDPSVVSGAELMVISPRGGAIGAISTTRPVYSSTNFRINKSFYDALNSSQPSAKFGSIFRDTKNNGLFDVLNRNFTLLGDPSMRLAVAEKKVRFRESPDTLRALQKVNLTMEVVDSGTGNVDAAFNGIARVVVYDKENRFRTLGNQDSREVYREFRSKLFDGQVSVVNGKLDCEFLMPKDMDYSYGPGKVNVYATRSDGLADAGDQLSVVTGGSAPMHVDITPPEIEAWLNDETFRSGDVTNDSPTLMITLRDDSGINVSKAGIGHDITLTLNDSLVLTLNDYYMADLDSYKSGRIIYPFESLPPGNYQIRIKVWDIYTNPAETAFGFQVESSNGIKLQELKVFPNPFDKDLSFELSHNRPNDDIEIVFRLFTEKGQQLDKLYWRYYSGEQTIRQSLMNSSLSGILQKLIAYMYSIEVRSLKDNTVDKRGGRLVRSP